MYDHHRDCCITGGELVKAGDVPGDGEDHHRHNVDAARESVHPGLHKYQELKTSKHIWRVWKRQGMMKYQCRLWTTDMNLSAVTDTVDLLKRDAFFAHQIFVWIFFAHQIFEWIFIAHQILEWEFIAHQIFVQVFIAQQIFVWIFSARQIFKQVFISHQIFQKEFIAHQIFVRVLIAHQIFSKTSGEQWILV